MVQGAKRSGGGELAAVCPSESVWASASHWEGANGTVVEVEGGPFHVTRCAAPGTPCRGIDDLQ